MTRESKERLERHRKVLASLENRFDQTYEEITITESEKNRIPIEEAHRQRDILIKALINGEKMAHRERQEKKETKERDLRLRAHLGQTFVPGDRCVMCDKPIDSRDELLIMVSHPELRGYYYHSICIDKWRAEKKRISLARQKRRTELPSPKYDRAIPSTNPDEAQARGQRRRKMRGK